MEQLTPAAPAVAPREPEKLVLPAAALEALVAMALRTELGATAWRFFAIAHGEPAWLAPGRWRLRVPDGVLLPAAAPARDAAAEEEG
jgi:hypothetical protein